VYHYLFTNDLRISILEKTMKDVATMHINGTVPSAKEDKGVNNNALTLGFYFNLMDGSNCSYIAAKGNVRRVVLNFVKKFQYPNLRTQKSYEDAKKDGIRLVPMRTILKLLYTIYINEGSTGFLTKDEIKEFIFYNKSIAKSKSQNIVEVYNQLKIFRSSGKKPESIALQNERDWNQEDRQIREMIKVLLWSGCVVETNKGEYSIRHSNLTTIEKAEIFDILTSNDFWDGEDKESYFAYMDIDLNAEDDTDEIQKGNLNYSLNQEISLPYNRILFGAPGTGKSYKLDEERLVFGENYERVTFHPNYSYAQFVGAYKPKPRVRDGREYVSYEFVPGPFLRTWVKAQKSISDGENRNYLLIIEEINRANVAAVFGDVFQLLDRKSDGTSEYEIATSEEMRDYLVNQCGFPLEEVITIKIPSNMYIWATMNSADQGVMPMDSAFKRRWNFEYIGINDGRAEIEESEITLKPYGTIKWDKLRTCINDKLINVGVNEDKLIGPFFLSKKELNSSLIDEIFKSKLLMYLFEDVLKHRKGKVFKIEFNTFSKIVDGYNKGEKIFDFIVDEVTVSKVSESALSIVAEDSGQYSMEIK